MPRTATQTTRNLIIYDMVLKGATQQSVGEKFGITQQRVHSIVKREQDRRVKDHVKAFDPVSHPRPGQVETMVEGVDKYDERAWWM